jgi:methyl-accepting chemotaxis protein
MNAQRTRIPFFRSIRGKLLIAFLVLALIPLILVSIMAYVQTRTMLKQAAYDKLEAMRTIRRDQITRYFTERQSDMGVLVDVVDSLRQEAFAKLAAVQTIKKHQLETYFGTISGQVSTLSQDRMIIQAMRDLKQSFHRLGEDLDLDAAEVQQREAAVQSYYQGEYLTRLNPNLAVPATVDTYWPADVETHLAQYLYLAANPNPTGSKENLDDAGDGSRYSRYHRIYHPTIRDYLRKFGYYDVFLVDSDTGHIIYTVFKEADYGTSLLTGPYKDTNLAQAFRAANAATDPNFVYLDDFEPYAPSYNEPAAFIASPIFDGEERIGVLLFQMPIGRIDAIAQERSGLGETGETYLVGELDGVTSYRSDRVVKTGKIGDPRSDPYTERALAGESGTDLKIGSTGDVEIVSFAPLEIPDLNWCIITTVALEETIAPVVEGETKDVFTKYIERYGYYDLFLINWDGYVFYSVAREADYHTNMVDGQYSDSNLGRLVRQVIETRQFGFADFQPYAPSDGEPAAFIAQPVVHKGEVKIIVALQLPLEGINFIMGVREGMGETGQTYLVGADLRMRSDSLLNPETHSVVASFLGTLEENGVNTEASRQALQGESGTGVILDYRGQRVVSSWSPVNVLGSGWAVLAEVDVAEAFAKADRMGKILSGIAVVVAVGVLIVTFWITCALARPITRLTVVARRVADGDLEMQVPVAARDETGQLAQAFNSMTVQLRDLIGGLEQEIVERVRAEEELQKAHDELEERVKVRTRDLEAANKELEAFAYSVSHDLRAPLRAIDGFSQALLEDYADRLDEQGKGFLNRVRAASQRIGDLIDDILKLSRLTRGEMCYESVDLSALAAEISEELESSEPERDVEFVITPGLTVRGDAHLLQIALENLLGNAWKFTSRKKRARIEFGAKEVEGERAFYVSDNGAGFDMAYADQLFVPFQRLHRAAEFLGTGIGLAIVQRVLHRHGGCIWAEGVVDEGATFYFVL